jgi:hypothetical protein
MGHNVGTNKLARLSPVWIRRLTRVAFGQICRRISHHPGLVATDSDLFVPMIPKIYEQERTGTIPGLDRARRASRPLFLENTSSNICGIDHLVATNRLLHNSDSEGA